MLRILYKIANAMQKPMQHVMLKMFYHKKSNYAKTTNIYFCHTKESNTGPMASQSDAVPLVY